MRAKSTVAGAMLAKYLFSPNQSSFHGSLVAIIVTDESVRVHAHCKMHECIIRFDIISTQGRMNNNRLLIVSPLHMLRNRGSR
ncbi:MAG: hypothetical protein QOG46_2796 [Pseudonocardiales bacterium]|jgi:hypothetical protein|nr:hypothetical protein [Pseudonocardiales bacterium]